MSDALVVRKLDHYYGPKYVLKNISFRVKTGDFFVIIGPNGAGKTSLLKVVAGVEKYEEGHLEIFGVKQSQIKRKNLARKIAVVPQHVPVDFPFTVADTVLMGRSPHLGLMGMESKSDIEIAEQAMMFTDILHLADRRLEILSGGERQRVIIARAICQQPRIILLDEPTASLDPSHQLKIMDLMERFREEHDTTVIMVSHDLNLAAMYGNRIMIMKDGEVMNLGAPHDVLSWDKLEFSYGCYMHVDESPIGKVPRITPVPEKFR